MSKTLQWKKTIGILAIILGGLRFITGIISFSEILGLDLDEEAINIGYASGYLTYDIVNYIFLIKNILPVELLALGSIFILGIILLCSDRKIPDDMPRPKSRKIAMSIFIISIIYLIAEMILFLSIPSSLSEEISSVEIIPSLGFVITTITFCALGLFNKKGATNDETSRYILDPKTYQERTAILQPKTNPLDEEIDNLKKEIEKRKLEKELAELNDKKLTEIEQLKKELSELE